MKAIQIEVLAALFSAAFTASGATVASHRSLTLDGAHKVISAAVEEAKKNRAMGVIAVVDDGGNLMALERIDGTFAAGANISIGKARTAALFKRPSKFFEDVIGKGRTAMVALNDFTPLQGGVPIVVDGEIVGAVGVSGANSAQQDEDFAKAGAAALATPEMSRQIKVDYIDGNHVQAAFAKGMPLLEVEPYKIHASRREGPGQAEIHERDTDIVHVLSGSATLVTGGTARNAKTVAAEELRGDSIENGESRRISPGDVVVIPNGVPHQFLDVTAPLTYYVVKVRSHEGGM